MYRTVACRRIGLISDYNSLVSLVNQFHAGPKVHVIKTSRVLENVCYVLQSLLYSLVYTPSVFSFFSLHCGLNIECVRSLVV